jgi:hypothetical protein
MKIWVDFSPVASHRLTSQAGKRRSAWFSAAVVQLEAGTVEGSMAKSAFLLPILSAAIAWRPHEMA